MRILLILSCLLSHRVWREWVIENDTITGMQFVMGEKCGSTDREATVCDVHIEKNSQKMFITNVFIAVGRIYQMTYALAT